MSTRGGYQQHHCMKDFEQASFHYLGQGQADSIPFHQRSGTSSLCKLGTTPKSFPFLFHPDSQTPPRHPVQVHPGRNQNQDDQFRPLYQKFQSQNSLVCSQIFRGPPPRTNIGVIKFALGDPTSGTILLRLDPVRKTHSGPRRRGASIPGDGGTRGAIRLIRGLTDVGPVGGGGLLICVRGCLHSENRFQERTLLDSLQYTPDDTTLLCELTRTTLLRIV